MTTSLVFDPKEEVGRIFRYARTPKRRCETERLSVFEQALGWCRSPN